MILRFKLYSIAGATALLAAPSDAFTPATFRRTAIAPRTRAAVAVPPTAVTTATTTTARPASLNPDWDNEDFLSSLGGGKEEMEKANEKYYKQMEGRQAMDEWRARKFAEQQQQKASPSQPAAQEDPMKQRDGPSPEFFKKIGLAGDQPPQTGQRPMQPPPPQQMQKPPPQKVQPPQPQQQMMQPPPQPHQQPPPQQFFDQNGNPVSVPMVYDQNGNLVPFNPQQTQQPPAQPPMPPQVNPGPIVVEPPLPAKTKGTDSPRPVGFNPDAYTMSNTADVYFAQLKQDSKLRKIARMKGDLETANKVFDDDSVQQIKDSWNENPYTKEKNLAEARAEIEGTVRAQTLASDDGPQTSTGISYKEKLEMMKGKRMGGGGAPTKFVKPVAASAPPKVEPPVAAAASGAPPKFYQPKVGTTVPPKVEQPKVGMAVPPKVGQPMTKAPPVTSTPPPPAAVPPATKAAAATPAAASMDGDAVRGKVRTLQGLLLKHRGGPGFGAGRLRAPEAQRLEDTMEEVKGILRSETGMADDKPAAAAQSAVAPTAPAVESEPAAAQAIAASPPPPRTMPAAPAVPAPAQAATLVSQSAAAGGPPDPLAGSVACVEAALRMYKDSSPADRAAMMIPLREALVAAASASNKYIAESQLHAHRTAMEAGPPAAAAAPVEDATSPVMGFPTTYAVTKPEEDGLSAERNPPVAVAAAGADWAENEKKLEDAYNALLQAGGEGGKLGLKNISGDEANALADKLVAMRGVLLDELNDGS